MATVSDRLKKIVVEQLGVDESEVVQPPRLLTIRCRFTRPGRVDMSIERASARRLRR
jgi:hypothetical protein